MITITHICDGGYCALQAYRIFWQTLPPNDWRGHERSKHQESRRRITPRMEQGSEYELVAAIQFLSAVELAHELNYHVTIFRDQSNEINVLLTREDECSFVESTPSEHEVTVAIP